MKKLIAAVLCAIFIIVGTGTPALAYTPTGVVIQAQAAILVNLDTDKVMFERNIDTPLHPASLTKIMTAVLALESGKDLDATVITVPQYCLDLLLGTGSSMSGIKAGEKLTLRQLLYAMLMMSGNDVANVLADYFGGGDISAFIRMMNERAAELGMKNTHYVNPHGLTEDTHLTTVSDMLILTRHAMELPLFMEVVSTVRYELPATNLSEKRVLTTSNLMMDSNSSYYYRYVKGIKTGTTDEAGRCLITTASKDGYRYLAIVMKCPHKDSKGNSIRADFSDTKALYEWAFNSFEYKEILNGTEPIEELKVGLSWDTDFVQLVPKTPLAAVIPKEANASSIEYEVHLQDEKVDAPIQKGKVYGSVDIVYAKEVIGSVELVAADSVERSRLLYLYQQFLRVLNSTLFKIGAALLGVLLIFLIILTVIRNKRKRRRRVRSYRRV